MKPDDIMPLICLRCKKDIPLTVQTFEEISYTHYSYCEDCLREGLKLLKTKDKEKKMPSAQPDIKAAYEQGRIQGHVEMRTELLMQLKEIVGDEVWKNI